MSIKPVKIKQHDITDCGAACLASIAAAHGLKLPISRIRQIASTDQKGTNVLGMVEAAEKLGFIAKGVRGKAESLAKIPKPAIAHVIVKESLHHYVVIYDVKPKYILIMDPAYGTLIKKNHKDFMTEWTGVLILLQPAESFQKANEKSSLLRRFFNLVKPHKSVLFQAFLGAVIYTLLGLSTSIYVQKLLDFVLVDGNKNLLNLLSIVVIALLIFRVVISFFKSNFILKTGQAIDCQLILGYYQHLMTLPQKFFDTMRTGEIISRVNDAVKIRSFINDVSVELVVNVLVVFFSFGLLSLYSLKIALITLSIIPLYLITYWLTNKINKKYERKVMENTAELESHLVESLNAMSTIKRFRLESFADFKTEIRFVKLLKSIYTSAMTSISSMHASELISSTFTIVLLWTGAYFVMDKTITPGELMSCYAILGYLTGPLNRIIGMNKTIQNALIAADRLFEIMDLERESDTNKITITQGDVGDLTFRDVFFRYGSRVTVFESLTLNISKGQYTAIVGESGSGKSTLVSLLQNIYPIEKGEIKIGNYSLKNISNESLRNIVSVVPQKIDLFSGNVIDNIAVGDLEPDMKRITDVCESLGLTKFIESLPGGFNTYLGENGASLSGGQKQRIAIARAIYQEPEILILDEATSSLDSISEQFVQTTIEYLRNRNKTIIVIAHRLSTVMKADKIVVLDQGNVVEEGCHQHLLSSKGHYFKLWKQQIPEIGAIHSLLAD